jgi:phage terminase large subunit-like protein
MSPRTHSQNSTRSRRLAPGARAELDAFARFCGLLQLEDGRSLTLEPFQREMLADYFAGAAETLILISKKNGKSTLLAAIALHHLVTTPGAECVVAAASRDQATILFDQAAGFVRRSEQLQVRLDVKRGYRQIRSQVGRIRVLASDVDTADGVIPTLAMVDELHRHRSADLYGVFRDGLGPRGGRMITISTAGDDEESPLGTMRRAAYRLALVERDGPHRRCASSDGAYVMHEWALDPEDDRHDMKVVKGANPASWQTLEALARRHDSPSMTEWQWARFACGVWLQGEDTAIGPVEWATCGIDDDSPAGLTWRLGLDVGWKEDTTAIVGHAFDDDGNVWLTCPVVLVPPAQQGVALRKKDVLAAVQSLAEELGASQVVLDPENDGEVIAQDLEEELGLEVVAHSQKPAPMAQAAERFYAAVREGKLKHPRDDVLTRHVLNAHRKATDDGRWRFVKENKQSKKHIDALIAAAMVHNVAVEESTTSPMPLAAWA